jgi:hypothetical protein
LFVNSEDRNYVFKLHDGVVRHKQIVTTSTTEAENDTLTRVAREATWLRQLLTELRYYGKDLEPFKLLRDNELSIKLAYSKELSCVYKTH